jgi:hypothetical protein
MINWAFSDVSSRMAVSHHANAGEKGSPVFPCDAISYVHGLRREGFQIVLNGDRMRIRGSPGVLQVRMCVRLNVS